MERQTRTLLRLIATDLADEIIDMLRDGPMTEKVLRERTGVSRQTLNRQLDALGGLGIVEPLSKPVKGKGRNPRIWHLNLLAVVRFGNAADEFALEVLETRAEHQRQALRDSRKSRLRDVSSDS